MTRFKTRSLVFKGALLSPANFDKETFDENEQELANLVSRLADEFSRGEDVSLNDVCNQYPQFAEDLRDVWGTIAVTNAAGRETSSMSSPVNEIASALELPFQLGSYLLEEEIGRGGMGIVYRASREEDGYPVAIKMMLKGEFASEVDRKRFRTEAQAAANLDHPGIIPIHDIGEHQGRAYFCMEYIEGETLATRLDRGPMPARRAARILRDIALAVEYAHQQGVLHRDLKPSNIMIDGNGDPYVADFGLAKLIQEEHSLTRSGSVIGTPSYMAPEQAAGERGEVGPASEVYGLGAILYHMLAGRPPFLAATPVDTVLMVLEQDPIAPRVLNRRADRQLEMIAMRCLQKPQDLRYSTAGELVQDLDAFLSNRPVSARNGRLVQIVGNLFRETHHAVVLENWGLLWMWHSLVLLLACFATNIMYLWQGKLLQPFHYWLVWFAGFGTWAAVFWLLRRRMGPVTFVERQIAHLWAASMLCVGMLHPLELILGLGVLQLSPIIAVLAAMVFLVKAGILSGTFYIHSAAMFVTAFVMAFAVNYSMFIFGLVSAACFFFSGLKYYRRSKSNSRGASRY